MGGFSFARCAGLPNQAAVRAVFFVWGIAIPGGGTAGGKIAVGSRLNIPKK